MKQTIVTYFLMLLLRVLVGGKVLNHVKQIVITLLDIDIPNSTKRVKAYNELRLLYKDLSVSMINLLIETSVAYVKATKP